ncbi:MAG: hypothetical protein AAGA54_26750 [Myxococcota bacterium]
MLAVGKDLFATCGKCGDVWHVIAAMSGDRVTKVTCKNCMGSHRYKAPAGEVDVNANAKSKRRTVASRRSPKSVTPPSADNPLIEANMDRPIQEYSMRTTFEPGDRVAHPKFGMGVVEGTPETGKMLVFFKSAGRKTLAHARG